jgi:hypothetical protein
MHSAYVALLGPSLFIITALILGAITPRYHPLQNTISELALGKYGVLQTLNFVVSGTLMLLLAVLVFWQHFSTYGVVCVAIMSLVLLLSAVFKTDPLTKQWSTKTGAIHNVLFMVGAPAMVSAQLVLAVTQSGTAFGLFSLACSLVSVPTMVFVVVGRSYRGLVQRILVSTLMVWTTVFAVAGGILT